MYRKITATIATTIMITALLASLGGTAANPSGSLSPSTVGGDQWVILTLSVNNDTGHEIAKIRLRDKSTTPKWDEPMGGDWSTEDVAENWGNVSDNILAASVKLSKVSDNIDEANTNLLAAGDYLLKAAENLEAAGDSLKGSSDDNASAAGNAMKFAALYLVAAAENMATAPQNLNTIDAKIENCVGEGTLKENLENAAQILINDGDDAYLNSAGQHLKAAAENLDSAGYWIGFGEPGDAVDNLLGAADNFENAGDNLKGSSDFDEDKAGKILLNKVGPNVRKAAQALQKMDDNLNEAGGALLNINDKLFENAETLIMDNVSNTIDYLSAAATTHIANGAGWLYNAGAGTADIWLAGDEIGRAGIDLDSAQTADKVNFGSKYLGTRPGSVDNQLITIGENLGMSGFPGASWDGVIDLMTVKSAFETAATKLASAATVLSGTAGQLAPSNWALTEPQDGDVELTAENREFQVSAGGSEDFTFLWKSAATSGDYDFKVWYYDNQGNLQQTETLTVTVDATGPSADTFKVTQSNVGVENVVGNTYDNGMAKITLTASEPVSELNTAYIENASGDNLLPPLEMSDWNQPDNDNKTFTYEFSVGEWDGQGMRVRIKKPWSTDMTNNDNNDNAIVNFKVDTRSPWFEDNGLSIFRTLPQILRSGTGTKFLTDNMAEHTVTGRVEDNATGARFGYENTHEDVVSIDITYNGTTISTMREPSDNFTKTFDLNEGLNSIIKVTATDWTGNTISDNIENILIDTEPPTVSFDTLLGDSWDENKELINDNKPTISLTVSDVGLGVTYPENIDVKLDNDDNYWNPDKPWSFALTLENEDVWQWDASAGQATFENTIDNDTGLHDGVYWVTLRVSDNIKHAGENWVTYAQSFKLDQTAPDPTLGDLDSAVESDGDPVLISGTGLASGTNVTGESSLTLEGTASEKGLTVKIYTKDDGSYTEVGSTTLASGEDEWEIDMTGLTEGKQELYIEETDKAGNTSEKVELGYFWVDTTQPSLSLTSDTTALDGTTTKESSVLVEGTVTDGVCDTKDINVFVRAPYYDQPQGYPVSVADDGSFSISVPLREGVNKISVVAEDEVPNTSIKSLTVERKVTPWFMYAAIAAIVAIILAVIAILRRAQ